MIICLTGGFGGVKFILELLKVVKEKLVIICNVGDDIELYGLKISPDIDTVIYGLSGLLDESRTWGIRGDSFNFLQQFKRFAKDVWFSLGDKDLAVHIYRTWRMKNGAKLSQVISEIKQMLDIKHEILPCTDDTLQTFVETSNEIIHYQEFFVKHLAKPEIKEVYYYAKRDAKSDRYKKYFAKDILLNNKSIVSPSEGLLDLFEKVEKVIICPSNPVASIGPILAVEGIKNFLEEKEVIAISPFVKNLPIKDKSIQRRILAQKKLIEAIGCEHTPLGIAKLYSRFLDTFFLDIRDCEYIQSIEELGVKVVLGEVVANSKLEKEKLMKTLLEILK